MTHTKQMSEFEGTFHRTNWTPTDGKCRYCGKETVELKTWESDCGGYLDVKYRCNSCGKAWWVEGSDA